MKGTRTLAMTKTETHIAVMGEKMKKMYLNKKFFRSTASYIVGTDAQSTIFMNYPFLHSTPFQSKHNHIGLSDDRAAIDNNQ